MAAPIQALKRAVYSVKARWSFMQFMRNPADTPEIFRMTQAFHRSAPREVVERMLGILLADPVLKEQWESRYWPQIPSLEVLRTYPEGSFGREAAAFFDRWNLDVDLFPKPNFASPEDYLTSRMYQAHDFWHVLTGYTPDLEDELALQAFGVGQIRQAIGLVIIAGGIMHILQKHPERSESIMTSLTQGYEMGKRSQCLLTAPIFDQMHRPLAELRLELGLKVPVKGFEPEAVAV